MWVWGVSIKDYANLSVVFQRYAARFDCGCLYKLHVELANETEVDIENGVVQIERRIEQWEGREWHQVRKTCLSALI